MVDAIIIGSGFAGSVMAEQLSRQNKKVLVLESRDHIGGNCYDVKDEHGVLIHQYGPHIFHTNSEEVYTYLSQFTKWYDYSHEVAAFIDGEYMPVPFNLNTLKMVYGEAKADLLGKKLLDEYGEGTRVPILKLKENSDPDIAAIADYVYNNVFLKYTMKQWGQKPEEIDPSVTARVPVLISYDNRYFQDKYQGMPLDGYTPVFEKMLKHPNIEVKLNTDARDVLTFDDHGVKYEGSYFKGDIIYTGPIDELFNCELGRLPYRTLDFVFEYHDTSSYQPKAVVNYTVSEEYTRITEYKKLTGQNISGTTTMKEYPRSYTGKDGEIPYYAISNDENQALYKQYVDKVSGYENVHLLGRLAEYKYYNMDGIVYMALQLAEKLNNI